jgi:hypothetical protein
MLIRRRKNTLAGKQTHDQAASQPDQPDPSSADTGAFIYHDQPVGAGH